MKFHHVLCWIQKDVNNTGRAAEEEHEYGILFVRSLWVVKSLLGDRVILVCHHDFLLPKEAVGEEVVDQAVHIRRNCLNQPVIDI